MIVWRRRTSMMLRSMGIAVLLSLSCGHVAGAQIAGEIYHQEFQPGKLGITGCRYDETRRTIHVRFANGYDQRAGIYYYILVHRIGDTRWIPMFSHDVGAGVAGHGTTTQVLYPGASIDRLRCGVSSWYFANVPEPARCEAVKPTSTLDNPIVQAAIGKYTNEHLHNVRMRVVVESNGRPRLSTLRLLGSTGVSQIDAALIRAYTQAHYTAAVAADCSPRAATLTDDITFHK